MTLDFSKPITTRDGRAVRILCTDWNHNGGCPVLGLVSIDCGIEILDTWTIEGNRQRSPTKNGDLINSPVKRRGWVNIFFDPYATYACGTVWGSEDEAKQAADPRVVATIQLPEWEDSRS